MRIDGLDLHAHDCRLQGRAVEIEVAQRRAGRSDLARWLDEGSTACGGTGEWWMLIEHDTGRYVTASRQDAKKNRSDQIPLLRNHD
jgi:hypothetical protein